VTTQIAVVSKMGVALASDSVITITNGDHQKTLNNSRKMIDVGSAHKMMVMIAGNSELNNLPVELFLLRWIKDLGDPLETPVGYVESFVEWLGRNSTGANQTETEAIENAIESFLIDISLGIQEALNQESPAPYSDDFNFWYQASAENARKYNKAAKDVVDRSLAGLDSSYSWTFYSVDTASKNMPTSLAKSLVSQWFKEKALSPALRQKLVEALPLALSKRTDTLNPPQTVLSFVGYGSNSYTPSVVEFYLEGAMPRMVRGWYSQQHIDGIRGATIYYPAQRDAIKTFLNGYDDELLRETAAFLRSAIKKLETDDWLQRQTEGFKEVNARLKPATAKALATLLADESALGELAANLNSEIRTYGSSHYTNLLDTLTVMDLSALAEVAESLVGMQVLAAHNSSSSPHSGGIIEVATIDLQNGVKWHRRIPLTKTGLPELRSDSSLG
jgi:hypothetical protein